MNGKRNAPPQPAEPVTPATPRPLRLAFLRQRWLDVALLHWAIPPSAAAPFMPRDVRVDSFEGRTYVGLIPFRMVGSRIGRSPAVPYFGTFLETNVRLYSVDEHGRRGVVFRSLDAERLAVVLGARAVLGLPYVWARMDYGELSGGEGGEDGGEDGARRTYVTRRRDGTQSRVVVQVGDPIARPTPLQHWLTARWGLHTRRLGGTRYLPNEHEPWPLHEAEVADLDDALVTAAGLPGVTSRAPDSVLWSPGVSAAFGTAPQ